MLLCYSSRLFNCRELACHLKSHGPCGVTTLLYCSVYINEGVVQKGLQIVQSLCKKSLPLAAPRSVRSRHRKPLVYFACPVQDQSPKVTSTHILTYLWLEDNFPTVTREETLMGFELLTIFHIDRYERPFPPLQS